MAPVRATRRRFMQAVGGASVLTILGCNQREQTMLTLYTFGDSILDCGRYNEFGVHPGQLRATFPALTPRSPAKTSSR